MGEETPDLYAMNMLIHPNARIAFSMLVIVSGEDDHFQIVSEGTLAGTCVGNSRDDKSYKEDEERFMPLSRSKTCVQSLS